MLAGNLEFDFVRTNIPKTPPLHAALKSPLSEQLLAFREFGKSTRRVATKTTNSSGQGFEVPTFVNEFWTSKQREASRLHEISYRACFKPQLPRFFIQRLTQPGDLVYDPFMGRGTTLLEAALLNRPPAGCDVNPLSAVLIKPRLNPPTQSQVEERLREINFTHNGEI